MKYLKLTAKYMAGLVAAIVALNLIMAFIKWVTQSDAFIWLADADSSLGYGLIAVIIVLVAVGLLTFFCAPKKDA